MVLVSKRNRDAVGIWRRVIEDLGRRWNKAGADNHADNRNSARQQSLGAIEAPHLITKSRTRPACKARGCSGANVP